MSKTYSLEDLKKMKSKTDIERFKNTSEKEIMEQTIADPDLPNLSEEELKEFKLAKDRKNEQQ
tara:strand:+ start:774 stop:962 length:189 start_codon:yes stop_codon:yes gene_type:complete